MDRLPLAVPAKIAEQYRHQMKQPDLIFLTKENEAELKARLPEAVEEAEAMKKKAEAEHEAS